MSISGFIKAIGSKKMRLFGITAPPAAEGREGLALVAIVKNVGDYILEWLEFHTAAGARHVFLYDNGCTDDTLARIAASPFAASVTVIPWRMAGYDPATQRRISQQVGAYAHAVTTFGTDFERMAFIDIDEFLVPDPGLTLMEAITQHGDHSNISLPWHMFGHAGHETRPDGWVTRAFTDRAPVPYARDSDLLRFKCIVDPSRVSAVGVHSFETVDMGDRTANAAGQVVSNRARKQAAFFTSSPLQLNHYYLLSKAELETKLARGPINFGGAEGYRKRVLEKVAEIERAPVEDRKAVTYYDALSAQRGGAGNNFG
ncbi:glycosyltransferase family 92 protein [Thioclava sp.]|uniref:glycosyltransferase family 92 protein n=1 Tax=Thioclava sp. TaxID=1933450 RepID=UPI003242D92E